jgi:phage host-nuclease inhibitor protein Gam
MPSIFELTKEQADLKSKVEQGFFSEEDIADTFEGMEHELNDKISSYCHVLNSMNADLTTIKNEIERLKTLQNEKQNQIKRVKQTLISGLGGIDKTNFDTGLFKGHIRKGSQSVNVINSEEIPAQYIETKIVESADKTAIKNALKAGDKIPGVELITGDSSLVVK